MNKFEYGIFVDGDYIFVVNAEKYSEIEAVMLFEKETADKAEFKKGRFEICSTYLKWNFGFENTGNGHLNWWPEETKMLKGGCKVFIFSRV